MFFCSRPADVDECATGIALCPRFRKCVNTFGSYICKCHEGFDLQYINGKYQCSGTGSLYTLFLRIWLETAEDVWVEFTQSFVWLCLLLSVELGAVDACLKINHGWLWTYPLQPCTSYVQLWHFPVFFMIIHIIYCLGKKKRKGFAAKMQITDRRYDMGQI